MLYNHTKNKTQRGAENCSDMSLRGKLKGGKTKAKTKSKVEKKMKNQKKKKKKPYVL